jgi:phage terminase large subunit-like protein
MQSDGYRVNSIVVEDVAINREQSKFIEDLRIFLKQNNRNIIVNTYKPKMKKEDRIKFILEPKVSLHAIYLRKDMTDKSFTRKIEDQLYEFPNGKHDDVIDCLSQ